MRSWGRLPEDIRVHLRKREWEHPQRLRERLSGQRAFPLSVPLNPPSGAQALQDLAHFHAYVGAWRDWQSPGRVEWGSRAYRQLAAQEVPIKFQLDSIRALIEFLGPEAVERSRHWDRLMAPIVSLEPRLYHVLVRHLFELEALERQDAELMAKLLAQLRAGLGEGMYLRALPLRGVDTKFVETHFDLIGELMDELTSGEVHDAGGLMVWLGCRALDKGWLWVRPLCPRTQAQLGGMPLLRLSTDVLIAHPLPGAAVLVVENKQPGYALPALIDTVAVFGGGRNTAWMAAPWLASKRLAYWGDLDSWGLVFLADARSRQPHLSALMMDEATLLAHQERMGDEKTSCDRAPQALTPPERALFDALREGCYGHNRLEQERLSPDYVASKLTAWHNAPL